MPERLCYITDPDRGIQENSRTDTVSYSTRRLFTRVDACYHIEGNRIVIILINKARIWDLRNTVSKIKESNYVRTK